MLQESEDTINSSLPSIYNKLHSSPRCIILHYSPFKAVWDWITLLFVVYTAFLTPYITAFCLNKDFSKSQLNLDPSLRLSYAETSSIDPLVIMDVIIDIIFLFDIFINFRTTFLLNGDVISDPQKIAMNYIKSWFFVDAIAAIPFDLLLFGSGTSNTATVAGIFKISRLIRLVRVAKKIDQFSEYGAAVLLLLLATFVLISHWLACIFYVIAFIERPTLHAPIGWLDYLANITGKPFLKNDTFSGPDIRSIYITSLYFTYTILTSVGFGNIAPVTNLEKIFSIFAMMLGSLMSAVIFGNVSSIMLRIYQGSGEQQELQMSIKEFIRFHAIPKSLANRLLESHEQSRNCTSGIDMNSVLKSFPDCMQADICLHLNRKLLSSNEAFSQASPGCIRALSMKFKSTHAPPGDTLIHPGDVLSSIYFIARGSVETWRNGKLINQLNKDDSFGQNIGNSYLSDGQWKALKKSVYSVIISSYSDLHKISVQDLRNILDMYPEFSNRFLEKFHVTFDLGEFLEDQETCVDASLNLMKYNDQQSLVSNMKKDSSILVLSPNYATVQYLDSNPKNNCHVKWKNPRNLNVGKIIHNHKKFTKDVEWLPLLKKKKTNEDKRQLLRNKIVHVERKLIKLEDGIFTNIKSILQSLEQDSS